MSSRPTNVTEVFPGLWYVLSYFWPYIRKHQGLLTRSTLLLLCGVFVGLLEPWPLKFVLDSVIGQPLPIDAAGSSALDRLSPATLIALAAGMLVVLEVMRAAADYGCKVGLFVVGNRVVIEVRDDVYRHVQALSLAYHSQARRGDLIVRVTRDVSLLRDVASSALAPLVTSILVLAGMFGVMFWLQWRLTLLALTTVPLFWFSTVRITRRIREAAQKQRRREGAMAAIAAETIGAIEVVQALSLEANFSEDFSGRNRKSQKEDLKANRFSARLGRTVDVLLAVSSALVLWYGGLLILRGELSVGDLVVFLTYVKRSFRPAQDFAKYIARLAKATAAGERVIAVLEQEREIRDLPGAKPAGVFLGEIRFDNVSFSYVADRPVLQEVALNVAPGENVAIVGPSGVGKSTLAALLLRLYDPSQGRVLIDGRDIRSYTLESLRPQIAMVLQDNTLFSASIAANVAIGSKNATGDDVRAAAEAANALEFIEVLPESFGTMVGERGVTLSHGQRQRIAIARAMVRQAPILILDEPTTGLDGPSEQIVLDALDRLTEGKTTLTVTHDLRLAARADKVCYLDGGRVVEVGSHDDLLKLNGRYAQLHRAHSARVDQHSPEKRRVQAC